MPALPKQNGAKVIAFTDSPLSPISDYASHLLLAQSDMASFMDSFVAPMSIINAMIIHITHKREREITARFDKLEQVWDEYGVYTKRIPTTNKCSPGSQALGWRPFERLHVAMD